MVPGRRYSGDDGASSVDTRWNSFWANVVFGAVATIVLGMLPLIGVVAPVGGGALAGYFQNAGTMDGAKIGALAGAVAGIGIDVMAPPRFFGLLSGNVVEGYLLMVAVLWFVVWTATSAFGGALGARLAEDRYGSSGGRRR